MADAPAAHFRALLLPPNKSKKPMSKQAELTFHRRYLVHTVAPDGRACARCGERMPPKCIPGERLALGRTTRSVICYVVDWPLDDDEAECEARTEAAR